MFMPAGVHHLTAGFNNGTIDFFVKVDKALADKFNAQIKGNKMVMYFAVDPSETKAAFKPMKFKWQLRKGLFLTGRQLVADKHIKGFCAPCFKINADFKKARQFGNTTLFKAGDIGSQSRPARITGLAPRCIGYQTGTDKASFHTIQPINHNTP